MKFSVIFFPSFSPILHEIWSPFCYFLWRAWRWLKQQAYLSNLHKDIYIKARIKTQAHSMDFDQSIHFLFFFFLLSPSIPFPLSVTFLFSLSIFRALLEHDKSERDVMTRDPLLALGGGRENERENERGEEGGVGGQERERKDERDLSGNYCSQGIDSRL